MNQSTFKNTITISHTAIKYPNGYYFCFRSFHSFRKYLTFHDCFTTFHLSNFGVNFNRLQVGFRYFTFSVPFAYRYSGKLSNALFSCL